MPELQFYDVWVENDETNKQRVDATSYENAAEEYANYYGYIEDDSYETYIVQRIDEIKKVLVQVNKNITIDYFSEIIGAEND